MQLQLFDVQQYNALYYKHFLSTDLGRLYSSIPFKDLTAHLRPHIKQCPQGANPIFSLEGGIGLMFLKHYTGMSDAKLIERLNTDWPLQVFCGLSPKDDWGIKDADLPGRWRRFIGKHMDMSKMQSGLAQAWKEDLVHPHVSMQDATVYESYIKYPTDVKLLWDCIQWVQSKMKLTCQLGKFVKPRSKYKQQIVKVLAFMKKRKKKHREERAMRRSLLYLLSKLLGQLQALLNKGGRDLVCCFNSKFFDRLKTIKKILIQQRYHFDQPDKPVPDRIVSLFKPYLRPIVRGKENKPVEFGAKVHQVQVGGCNFIEHLDFNAFHEGNRLKKAIRFQQSLFGPVHQVGADRLYATNKNRKFCTENQIATNFVPKGRLGPQEEEKKTMRKQLATIRATHLEGSFGNEKNHYLLRKVKARTEETERVWIFFGVHTANAVKVMKSRLAQQKQKEYYEIEQQRARAS